MNMFVRYMVQYARGALRCPALFMIFVFNGQCAKPNPMQEVHESYMQGILALRHTAYSCIGLSALSMASMSAGHAENQTLKNVAMAVALGSGVYSIWHGFAALEHALKALRPDFMKKFSTRG